MRNLVCLAAVFSLALAVGCGKAPEKAVEETAEKTLETQPGDDADVDVSEDGMTVTSSDEDGTYTYQAGNEATIPDGFPADVYVYEGATVQMSSDSPDGFMLAFETDAAFATVVDAYKAEMPAAGWTELTGTTMEGTQMLIYGIGDRMVDVGIFDENGVTKISLSVSK
jgi:hypothetical protein